MRLEAAPHAVLTDQLAGDEDAIELGHEPMGRGDPLVEVFGGDRDAMEETIRRVIQDAPQECDCERAYRKSEASRPASYERPHPIALGICACTTARDGG